ncbi:hypothetical protein GCM10023189_01930 [Nibrella saemangeumensis]|uniref:Lipoprotein n=1 Tax=Nibrella saemangeumensis TaxID=1084526 RepID=A0ABP8MBA1_9BACT
MFLAAACSSTNLSDSVESVTLSEHTRGYRKVITVTQKQTQVTINDKVYSRQTQPQQWKQLLESLRPIRLADLPSIKTRTERSAVDAAYISQVTVLAAEKTYESNFFDHTTPPKELADVVKTINATAQGIVPEESTRN